MTPTAERMLRLPKAESDEHMERARLYNMILYGLGLTTDAERSRIANRISKVEHEIRKSFEGAA